MIGLTSRTTSPSSVQKSRSTPWVAGCCGPMLTVNSSVSGSSCSTGVSRVPVIGSSGSVWTTGGSVIPARQLVLVVGEEDGLPAHREVAPLRIALVVLRHQDPAQVGVAVEHHAEEVEDLAFLVVGGGEQVHDGRQGRVVDPHPGPHPEPIESFGREKLVVHPEPRLLRQVV